MLTFLLFAYPRLPPFFAANVLAGRTVNNKEPHYYENFHTAIIKNNVSKMKITHILPLQYKFQRVYYLPRNCQSRISLCEILSVTIAAVVRQIGSTHTRKRNAKLSNHIWFKQSMTIVTINVHGQQYFAVVW